MKTYAETPSKVLVSWDAVEPERVRGTLRKYQVAYSTGDIHSERKANVIDARKFFENV